jgi:hypothetical protein
MSQQEHAGDLLQSKNNLHRFAQKESLDEVEEDDLWEYGREANRRYRGAIPYEEWSRLWSQRMGAARHKSRRQPRLPGF